MMILTKFAEQNIHKFSRDYKPRTKLEFVRSDKIQKLIANNSELLTYSFLANYINPYGFGLYITPSYKVSINRYPHLKQFVKKYRKFRNRKFYFIECKTDRSIQIMVKGRTVGAITMGNLSNGYSLSGMNLSTWYSFSNNSFIFWSEYEDIIFNKLQRIVDLKAFL